MKKVLIVGDENLPQEILKFLKEKGFSSFMDEEIYRVLKTEYGIRDALTKLYNRKLFYEILTRESERAQRYNRPLSLLMIDIDHFKDINDKNGHLVGDRVLIKISNLLKKTIRRTDYICRYGGEEFAVILPETNLSQASCLAERLRCTIEEADYSLLLGKEKITVSIGLSNYHSGENLLDETKFVASADEALYLAKNNGRNQVVSSDSAA